MPAQSEPPPEPSWALVANVAQIVHKGEGGQSPERGLEPFSPGTKLYCHPTS